MNSSKPAIQSVTVWGFIFSALGVLFPTLTSWLHLADPTTQQSIINIIGQLTTVGGAIVGLVGRLRSTTTISGIVSTTASSNLPPSGANMILAVASVGLLVVAGGSLLSGCSSLGAVASSPLGEGVIAASITAAVQAHPQATANDHLLAETAFVTGADAVEVAFQTGVLSGSNVATAKSDLETAYQVLVTGRNALAAAGASTTTALTTEEALADSTFTRVDAELGAN